MLHIAQLTYRPIDPDADSDLAFAHYSDAAAFTYGEVRSLSRGSYLRWLRSRVEEFPDGHVFAMLDGECVGQLELQAPYGLTIGYINLYAVRSGYRGRGLGRRMHDFVEHYFRSWEVRTIELHVSPRNTPAVRFYDAMGYRLIRRESDMYRLAREL